MTPALALGLLGFGGALVSLWLTGRVRAFAIAHAIMDVPNERSSHTIPTPRGGGLAVAVVVLLGIGLWSAFGFLEWWIMLGFVGGGTAVAIVGWFDDRAHVPASRRVVVHLLAAIWAVAWCGGFSTLHIGGTQLSISWAGSALAVVAIVWVTNLYNFMDGIDGIAGTETVTVAGAGGVLLVLGGDFGLAGIATLLVAAAAGFLVWNRPPARVFMGDVGSGLLGFLFATLAVTSENRGQLPSLGWALLLGVFVFDATVTLLRRMARGERWYAAHRSHAYQRLTDVGWSHAKVTLGILAFNLVLAALVATGHLAPGWWYATSVAGLAALALAYLAVERIAPRT